MNGPVNNDAAPQFLDLSPMQRMRIQLPGAEAINPLLADVIMDRNTGLKNMTVDYTSNNLFASEMNWSEIWIK